VAFPWTIPHAGRRPTSRGATLRTGSGVAIFFYRSPNDESLTNLRNGRNLGPCAAKHLHFPFSISGHTVSSKGVHEGPSAA
jgi:hypothetical protein